MAPTDYFKPFASKASGFFYAKESDIIGKYAVIYADPPWRYSQKGLQGAAEKHYSTMSIEELCALPVAELAAPDSVLFLWATFPQLPEALRLIRAWGFTYKSVALMGDVPRVELFARQTPPGWDVWGNEVEPTMGLRDILSQSGGDS